MPNLNEILKSLNQTKNEDLIDDFNANDYVPFIINRAFSFYPDTVMFANDLNRFSNIDRIMQYKYYCSGLKKKSRYSPWLKASKIENLELISDYYQVSRREAKELLNFLTTDDIEQINKALNKGG